jgi:CubicO group peptidase (beta-lactamase class C family)
VRDWSTVQTCSPDLLAEEVAMPRLLRQDAGVPRTLGYLGNGGAPGLPRRFGPNPRAYGAEGLGGQFAFCDPANRLAVGYVRSDCVAIDLFQGRLTQEVYRCASRLGLLPVVPPAPSFAASRVQRALTRYLEPRTVVAAAGPGR